MHVSYVHKNLMKVYFVIYYFIGFVFHFCTVFMSVVWFLHLFHLFLGVVFPFWSRFLSEREWKIRLHVVEVFGSVILCSLAPTIFVSVSEYTLGRFPPLLTLPSRDVSFYTIILSLTIVLASGINLTFSTFWTIHKVMLSHSGTCIHN